MTLQKLAIAPDETGYTIKENEYSLNYQALDGGLGRYRLDALDAVRTVNLQWSGSPLRWQTVRDFFDTNLALNCPQFLMDLQINTSGYVEYVCQILPDTIQSSGSGLTFNISASFEVLPLTVESTDWPIV